MGVVQGSIPCKSIFLLFFGTRWGGCGGIVRVHCVGVKATFVNLDRHFLFRKPTLNSTTIATVHVSRSKEIQDHDLLWRY
jgi:hypothetical protein